MMPYRLSWLRVLLLCGAALAVRLALPGPVAASCGVTDVGACVDDAQYTAWYGAAAFVWTAIDAPLLQAAYLIDVFRHWVVATAFMSAYQALVQLIDPLIVPFAVLALLGGYVLFAISPLTGGSRLMGLRHVLAWVILVPILLTAGGLLIGTTEQARVTVGTAIFAQISTIAPGAIFGVSADDMAAPQPLYEGANPCGSGTLARPDGALVGTLRTDDLAAALLYADAQDIHCPQAAGPGQDLPDRFFADPPDGPGYATQSRVGDLQLASERQAAVQRMQRGFTRLMLGVLPCVLAVVEALIQLLFALSLVVLWGGLPFALAFIFFEESSASVAALFRHGLGVVKTSWCCTFLIGLLSAALQASAAQGNATGYTAVACLALLLMLVLAATALRTLWGCFSLLNSTLLQGNGVSVTAPLDLAGPAALGAAGVAGGVATGGARLLAAGAGMVASAGVGSHQTGSGAYAAGAALGRVGPLATVGAVAAGMGWLDDAGELVAGLAAGHQTTRSVPAALRQMQRDGRRPDEAGVTMRDRAQEVQLARQVRTAQREPVLAGLGDRWQQLRGVAQVSATDGGADTGAAAPIARRYHAYHWADGQVTRLAPRPVDELPADALTVPNAGVNVPRLVRDGFVVQQNPDATVSFWQADADRAAAAVRDPQVLRAELRARQAVPEAALAQARRPTPPLPAVAAPTTPTVAAGANGAPGQEGRDA